MIDSFSRNIYIFNGVWQQANIKCILEFSQQDPISLVCLYSCVNIKNTILQTLTNHINSTSISVQFSVKETNESEPNQRKLQTEANLLRSVSLQQMNTIVIETLSHLTSLYYNPPQGVGRRSQDSTDNPSRLGQIERECITKQ